MLTLNDGRSELWQWDTGRTLAVDADCSQVHFSNKVFGRSIDVDVVDGLAIIPDILLQTDKELTAWAFVGTPEDGYTKISKVFKVNKRNKPADYVFTTPEQTTLGELIERLDKIEESRDPDAIKNAVDDYLANNPIEIDETDPTVPEWAKQPTKPSYTASEVGALSADTVIPTIPDNVSAFRNDAGYLTEHQDLTGYATEKYVQGYAQPKGDYLTEVPDAYATKEFVTNKIAEAELGGEEVDLSGYAQKSELPTKVSQLENDSGYLTEHQDISGKLDANKLPEAINTALAQAKAIGEFDGKDGVDGKDGAKGDKGDKGDTGATGAQGEPGKDGVNGKDGISPTVSVSAITGGHRITITDKNGTKTVDVLDGSDGEDGSNGKNGNGIKSAVLNADYTLTLTFDDGTSYTTPSIRGATGATGSAGKDGTSVTHSWSGTTLIVTSASGTTSANLKGDKGDKGDTGATGANGKDGTSVTVKSVSESPADGGSNVVAFSDGKTLTVKNGSKGDKGDSGKTPVRGTDYWTEADQESIVQQVMQALATPVYGRVDDENNIIVTASLADGTYTLKYEYADGKLVTIGDVVIGVNYTNLVPTAESYDSTEPYDGKGYKNGCYLSGSAPYEGSDGATVLTGYMPYAVPATGLPGTIYISGAEVQTISHCRIYFFGETKVMSGSGVQGTVLSTYYTIENLSNGVTKLTPIASGNTSKLIADSKAQSTAVYFRMSLVGTGENLIITVDEPIV